MASIAPRRWAWSVLPRVLTSRSASARASSDIVLRARSEKSPSRNAASMLESVWSGLTTRSRTTRETMSQHPMMNEPRVHVTLAE